MTTNESSSNLVVAAITTTEKVIPAAMVTSDDLLESLVLIDDRYSMTKAVVSTVVEGALRLLLRETRVIVVAVPINAPRVFVGTIRVGCLRSGTRLKGNTWIWGPYTCAPPASWGCRSRINAGFAQHTFFSSDRHGRECNRCMTRTTCGGEYCHKCILAGLDHPHAPIPYI